MFYCFFFNDTATTEIYTFPTRRSSDLALIAKELIALPAEKIEDRFGLPAGLGTALEIFGESTWGLLGYGFIYTNKESLSVDRKSTRLNSSHANISYAVLCLKKKKNILI